MKQPDRKDLSSLFALSALGLVWLWFNILGAPPVIVEYGAIGDNHNLLTIVASLAWQSVFVVAMIVLERFGAILDSKQARAIVPITVLALASIRTVIELAGHNQMGTLFALIASQLMLALVLHQWIARNRTRDRRIMLRDSALSFVIGGVLYLPLLFGMPVGTILLIVLPFLFSGLLFVSERSRDHGPTPEGKLPSPAKSSGILSWALVAFVVLAGFIIRPIALLGTITSPSSIALGMLYAGIVLVFLSLTATRIAFENSFGLISIAVTLVALLSLAFPEPNGIISMLATACWWLCFASLLVTRRPYLLIALYVLAAKVGTLLSELGYNGLYVNLCIAALLVTVATYLFLNDRKEAALQPEAPPLADFYERCDAFSRNADFTKRESEVFMLLMKGDSARRIAEDLVLSENTIKTHRANIYQKTGVSSRQELLDRFRLFCP